MSWEKEKASEPQLKLIHDLGYKGKPPYTKGDASKIISKLKLIEQANNLRDKVNFKPSDKELAVLDKVIGMYTTCLIKCVDVDITEAPVIGMLLKIWNDNI